MTELKDATTFTDAELAEMQAAIERAMKGIRDPEAMRRACEEMDRTRERIYQRVGLLDFAVPTIRALRDGDDA